MHGIGPNSDAIAQDPAKLAGGINFYSYASSSPTNSTDPFGLWTGNMGGQEAVRLAGGTYLRTAVALSSIQAEISALTIQ
jgi:hypothetical protein